MEENKIPTAEEFALQNMQNTDLDGITSTMIEFARMHVEKALDKADSIVAKNYYDGFHATRENILNSYPLHNIK